MRGVHELLQGPAGKVFAGVILAGAGVTAYFSMSSGASTAADATRTRWFVDAESNKPFRATLVDNQSIPLVSPFSGKATGVEAELCYWTADGKPKETPDPVLLNMRRTPPLPGPTFCPVCHRLVVGHNPSPTVRPAPPPTEAQFTADANQ